MKHFLCLAFSLIICASSLVAHAQTSQVMSVTPPLFQLSALPGEVWQSSVKVVNGNAYPLTVYAEVVNFVAEGEYGQGRFSPRMDQGGASLAEWIEIDPGPYTIPPEKTSDISFAIRVPADASPGGHYAAILVTTRPTGEKSGLAVETAQAVTTLFFVRIEGEVEELGVIREFRATELFVPTPHAELSLRFENKGNVHLQPRGDIIITNMWGTEQGKIPINYQTNFGNVLPESIRDFRFTWQRDLGITDIGRYKALVTLAYGSDGVKSVSSTAYFWVIPVKITLLTLAVVASFVGLIVWMVRLYIRRMLTLAGVPLDAPRARPEEYRTTRVPYRKVALPIHDGVLDLRERLTTRNEGPGMLPAILDFIEAYKRFFISVALLIVMAVVVTMYVLRAKEKDDNYEIIIKEGESETTLKGSDIEGIE